MTQRDKIEGLELKIKGLELKIELLELKGNNPFPYYPYFTPYIIPPTYPIYPSQPTVTWEVPNTTCGSLPENPLFM